MNNRFLIIGGGSIGKRHMKNLLTLQAGEIFAYDPRPDRRAEITQELGIPTVDSLEKGWEQKPTVAFITTPTSLHIPPALEAAKHGCHLFIEKPLSNQQNEELKELLNIVKKNHLTTLVGCNMRFHPGLRKVKHLLEEKAVGRIVSARVETGQYLPDWHPWEDYRKGYSARRDLGGGVILDAIHEIDYIRWLIGEIELIACLSAHLSHLEINTEDIASILVRFANGTFGEIHLDYVQRIPNRTCQVIGEEGTINWNCQMGEVRWYLSSSQKWEIFKNPSDFEMNQIYLDEIKHFLNCLSKKEHSTLDIFEAARVLHIALAAKLSSENNQFIKLN